jgi:hypothetical protein
MKRLAISLCGLLLAYSNAYAADFEPLERMDIATVSKNDPGYAEIRCAAMGLAFGHFNVQRLPQNTLDSLRLTTFSFSVLATMKRADARHTSLVKQAEGVLDDRGTAAVKYEESLKAVYTPEGLNLSDLVRSDMKYCMPLKKAMEARTG